ncbi:MAG: MarR family winged helix-turn-helix transcriptional regulator [Acidimicrobiia bacterium]
MSKSTNLARLLLDRFRWFDQALLMALNERMNLKLTSAQSLLFAELPLKGIRQADLARRFGVSRQAINELVQGLERQDLVEVVPDPDSRRSRLVRPTARGRRSVRLALETFTQLETELRTRIGDRPVDQLRRALVSDWGDPLERSSTSPERKVSTKLST